MGRTKNLAQVNPHVNSSTLFGTFKRTKEWNAGQCIRGESTMNEVRPDYDLGMASKYTSIHDQYRAGFRNTPRAGDEVRTFGLPTIRSDITRRGIKSVADP